MPVEFLGFTADRRISALMPLADDRLSDMLNSVSRLILRDADVGDLQAARMPEHGDVTLTVGDLFAVVGAGRRGNESQRRRTAVQRVTIGLGRYVVRGLLHIPASTLGDQAAPLQGGPAVVLAGRDTLVAITAASISYDCGGAATTEQHDTILINRARAAWIDIEREIDEDAYAAGWSLVERQAGESYAKDFTGTVAE